MVTCPGFITARVTTDSAQLEIHPFRGEWDTLGWLDTWYETFSGVDLLSSHVMLIFVIICYNIYIYNHLYGFVLFIIIIGIKLFYTGSESVSESKIINCSNPNIMLLAATISTYITLHPSTPHYLHLIISIIVGKINLFWFNPCSVVDRCRPWTVCKAGFCPFCGTRQGRILIGAKLFFLFRVMYSQE